VELEQMRPATPVGGGRRMHMRQRWRRRLQVLAVPLIILATAAPASAAPTARHVDSDYTLLRSAPASFVVGTAYKGWSIRDEGNQGAYAWARVGGNLRHCLWIYRNATAKGGRLVAGSCGAPRAYPSGSEFRRRFTNGMIGSNKANTDGAPIRLRPHGTCTVRNGKIDGWGNVEPWRAKTRPSHKLRGALTLGLDGRSTTGRHQVKWRYVTKDGKFVMVHATRYDPNDGRGRQNWFFISRDCLPL
jgi:hypothetical protein